MTTIEEQARSIFFAALERASDQWPAFLDGACGGSAELRARVDQLLQSHQAMGSIQGGAAKAPAVTTDEPLRERPGAVVGPYKLLEQIGEGGFGVVFLAEQTQPVRRKVALKVLKPGMDTRQVVARFEAERQALAIMDHPNIAKVFDGGATPSGRPYFVMELVKGVSITEYCDQNHLTPRQRLELFVSVCQAVQHAHHKGIIHRDLKPSNVLVSRHDTTPIVKVIDFGVAKALGQALTDMTLFTGIAQMIGTPLYMSPEQAGMSDLDIDTRSDIYSLGVLLYELLTGTTPFNKERFKKAAYDEIRRIIREEEPPKPSTRLSESTESLPSISAQRQTEPAKLTKLVRGELDWIVMKALEKDRNRRYDTANGFAADVQRYLADEPVQACPPSAGYRLRKFVRRNKTAFMTAALLTGALVFGTAISTILAIRAFQAEGLAQARLVAESKALQVADAAGKQAARERDLAQHRLYDARLAEAQAKRWSGRAGRRFGGLNALREASQLARDLDLGSTETLKLRNEAIACMALVDLRLDQKWRGYPSGSTTTGIAFDREMQRYARVDENGHILVRRLADNQEVARITGIGAPPHRAPDWRMFLDFSPNGRFLVAAGDKRFAVPMQIWDCNGPSPTCLLKTAPAGDNDFGRTVDFSPDNRALAARGSDGSSISLYDIPTGKELERFSLGQPIECLRFHPCGDRLAICSGSQVHVLDRSGRPVCAPLAHPQRLWAASWNAEGQLLATGCADGQAYVWDVASGKQQMIGKGDQGPVQHVAFSHRGDLLATLGDDETTRLWDARSGTELLRTNGLASAFSEDDRWLGLGTFGHDVGRWEVTTGGEYRSLYGHSREATVYSLEASSDGRWVASAASDGVRLWDAATGKAVGTVPTGATYAATFDRAGRFLFTSGNSGLYRWPIRVESNGPSVRALLGPPETIPVPAGVRPGRLSLSADGQTLVVQGRNSRSSVILDLDSPVNGPRFLDPSNFPGLSPDAIWVASAVADAHEGKLWEARTGKWVRDFPGIRTALVAFSPDNGWLVFATAADYRFFHVGSWEPGPRVPRDYGGYNPGPLAFTRDGKMAAIAYTPRVIQLIDCESGDEIATLAAPMPDELVSLCFTPDGSRLAAGAHKGVIQLWDLRRIREQLREMGLDWGASDYPPAAPTGDAKPVRVEVDAAAYQRIVQSHENYDKGEAHAAAQRWEQAVASYSQALDLDPTFATYLRRGHAYNSLKQWDQSIADNTKAIELQSTAAPAWNNRGFAYEGLRQWDQALANYTESLRLRPNHGPTLLNRARVYRLTDQFERADADLVQLSELSVDWWGQAGFNRALLQLTRGNRDGYREICSVLMKRPEAEVPPNAAAWVAWTCVLAPDPGVDAGQVVRVAERARDGLPKEPYHLVTLGATLYRAGRYAEAVRRLTEADAAYTEAKKCSSRAVWLFLAMAHHRLGCGEAARQALDKDMQTEKSRGEADHWRQMHVLLRREAEELVKQGQQENPKDKD